MTDVALAIAKIAYAHGVRDAVCSPGSRNAPLLVAFDREREISKHVVVDERNAAFMALGLAQASRNPVVLVCTSGTAVLNYAPAIAEAYYRNIPLIVVSADRPFHKINQDDSQTLPQPEIYDTFMNARINIPSFDSPGVPAYVERMVNDAFIQACGRIAGPVHINVEFSSPIPQFSSAQNPRVISCMLGETVLPHAEVLQLAEKLASARVLLIAGFMPSNHRLNKAVAAFGKNPNVAVMYETVSNLHLSSAAMITSQATALLSDNECRRLRPDIVIIMGGALVSGHTKKFLRQYSPDELWTLGFHRTTVDTFDCLSLSLECDEAPTLHSLSAKMKRFGCKSDYAHMWQVSYEESRKKIRQIVDAQTSFTEQRAIDIILERIKRNMNIVVSNGNSIRNLQMLMQKMPHAVFCNRGVSGIDGNLSTAVGSAIAYAGDTIFLTGDMTFQHDIGALSLRQSMPDRLKIIVLNNGGGNIFRYVATTADLEQREKYFCAPGFLPLQQLAEAYGLEYFHASDVEGLQKVLASLFNSSRPALLELMVDAESSVSFFR